MGTTLMPLDPATSPQRTNRILTISARLLPPEIVAGRRARLTRTVVIVSLVLVVALLGSWFAYAAHEKTVANDELATVADVAKQLRQQQKEPKFAEVSNVKAETTVLDKQLSTLLADDLRWSSLLGTVRSTGEPFEIEIESINGQLVKDTSTGGVKLPSATTSAQVGTLTVTGIAPSKPQLAKYVDALGELKAVANPYLTSATKKSDGNSFDFAIDLDIASDALGGRFTKTGGK